MKEKILRIPVKFTASIAGGFLTLKIEESEMSVSIRDVAAAEQKVKLEPGKSLFDLMLATAQAVVRDDGTREFTAAELYAEAYGKFGPNLRRNTWGAHVIASAPGHGSFKHHTARRDYFEYLGNGRYRLNSRYITKESNQ